MLAPKGGEMGFEELKQRQGAMWGSAPFEEIEPTIADMHETLVARVGVTPGEAWLDVGCGAGGAAFVAARAGASVTGVDLSPVLIESARRRAAEEGLDIRLDVADAERLPFEDGSFDVVSSTVGAIFAPSHEAAAGELARVLRPGGRLGLTAWRPEGSVGDFFRALAPFGPPPPEGAGSPLDWGREEHVQDLLGQQFELEFEDHVSIGRFESVDAAWELFARSFGPMKTLLESLEQEGQEEVRRVVADLHEKSRTPEGIVDRKEYVLVLGRRR
jgi:SAM-dependent methyltransferase